MIEAVEEFLSNNPTANLMFVLAVITVIKKLLTAYKKWAKEAGFEYGRAQRLIKASGDLADAVRKILTFVSANDDESDKDE